MVFAATAVLGSTPSAVPVGPDLVPDPVEPGSQDWRIASSGEASAWRADDGTIELRSEARGARATAWYPLRTDGGHGRYEVEAELQVPGRGRSVRLVVATPDPDDPLWAGSYRIHSERWGTVPLSVTAALDGRGAEVGLVVRGEGGVASLRRVDVVPVRRRPLWVIGVALTVAGWAALAWGWRARLGAHALAVLGVLGVGIAFPRPWLDRGFSWFVDAGIVDAEARMWLQKGGGHVGLFALLALVLRDRLGPVPTAAALVALAVATELAQRLAIARSASLTDVGFDLLGLAIGLGAGWALSRTRSGSPG